jgi:hypothetical protein
VGRAVSVTMIQGLTPENGSSDANSPAVTSHALASTSSGASHSPVPVTAAEAPTSLLAIEPAAFTSPALVSGAPVTAARDTATSPCSSAPSLADPHSPALPAEFSTVVVADHSRRAIPSLIQRIVPLKQRYTPLVQLQPRRRSSRLHCSDAETSLAGDRGDGDLENRIMSLERKVDLIEWWNLEDEEWKAEDREQKRDVEERLKQMAGLNSSFSIS